VGVAVGAGPTVGGVYEKPGAVWDGGRLGVCNGCGWTGCTLFVVAMPVDNGIPVSTRGLSAVDLGIGLICMEDAFSIIRGLPK
jgi:hypothetical protein